MAAGINERIWLEWLVKVRIIIITILLAIELAIVTLTTTNVNRQLFVLVILGWYVFAGLHLYVFLHRKSEWQMQSKLQVVTDLCFTTAVIYVTGGIDTTFVFLYPIIIIVASHPAVGNLGLPHRRHLFCAASAQPWSSPTST